MTRLLAILLIATLATRASAAGDDCPQSLWGGFLAPGAQSFEVAEDVRLPDGAAILGIRFGELVGPYAKLQLFVLYRDGCFTAALGQGSYDLTNRISAETGGGRVYHIDHYTLDSHATLGIYDAPLPYDAVRAEAMKLLK